MKITLYLLVGLLLYSSCSDSKSINFYFTENETCPTCVETKNMLIYNEFLYKNPNRLSSENNKLYKRILSQTEKDSLDHLIQRVQKRDTIYGGWPGHYEYDLDFSFMENNNILSTKVLDNTFPNENLKNIYFFLEKLWNTETYEEINNNNSGIHILHITDKHNTRKILPKRDSFIVWINLMLMNPKNMHKISELEFDYIVNFSYLLDTKSKPIENIYLSKDNLLILKFKDSLDLYSINLANNNKTPKLSYNKKS